MEGKVTDTNGDPVEGAKIDVYLFSENADRFGGAQNDADSGLDVDNISVRLDLTGLIEQGRVHASARSAADGTYTIEDVPTDGLVAVATKEGYSVDVKGMDTSNGTVTLDSLIVPVGDESIRANFVIAGGGGGEGVPPEAPDEEEIAPPAASEWTTFTIEDESGTVIADASGANSSIPASGGVVYIRGTHSDTSRQGAFLRVQKGSSTCAASQTHTEVIPLALVDGVIQSDRGDKQPWFLDGGYEQLQLDLDEEPASGDESFVVTTAEKCAPQTSPMVVVFTWDTDNVDADLHIWDAAQEHTFYGSSGERDGMRVRRGSSYGFLDIDDLNGFGPEVFTLYPGSSGTFALKAHFYSGRPDPVTTVKIRIVRWHEGVFKDETFQQQLPGPREWVEFGTFEVDGDAPVE